MRKRLIGGSMGQKGVEPSHLSEIDLRTSATVHYSSEDAAHPIEHMFDGTSGRGASRWQSARANVTEELVVEFDEPRHISHVAFEVEERLLQRTQELRAEFSCDGGHSYRRVFVQEYNFSPDGSTYECENLSVDLHGVTHFRLLVVPNKSGSGTASLTSMRLFS